jgi:hypothetical protein
MQPVRFGKIYTMDIPVPENFDLNDTTNRAIFYSDVFRACDIFRSTISNTRGAQPAEGFEEEHLDQPNPFIRMVLVDDDETPDQRAFLELNSLREFFNLSTDFIKQRLVSEDLKEDVNTTMRQKLQQAVLNFRQAIGERAIPVKVPPPLMGNLGYTLPIYKPDNDQKFL